FIDRGQVERYVPDGAGASLGDHADNGIHLGVLVILDPLLERADPGENAFNPALGQQRGRPRAPIVGPARTGRTRSITDDKIVITQRIKARPGDGNIHRTHSGRRHWRELRPALRWSRGGQAVNRWQGPPIEFEVVRAAGEVAAVAKRELLGEWIRRLDHLEFAVI